MNPQLGKLMLVFGGGLGVTGVLYGLSWFDVVPLNPATSVVFGVLAAVTLALMFLVMHLVKRVRAAGQRVSGIGEKVDQAIKELEAQEQDLYQRPWVVVAGEPGSGKTEMLRRCPGLLDDRFPEPVEGEGGTRDMNWWFVRGAVVIDTAGALLQLTNPGGESAANASEPASNPDTAQRQTLWREFLETLKTKRPLCPINGMILVIPVTSLVGKTQEQAEFTARQLYEQIGRLTQEVLECRFPLTVIVSKCDRLDGFEAFFQNVAGKKEQNAGFGWSADEVEGYPPAKFEHFLASLRQKLHRFRMNLLYKPPQFDGEQSRLDATDSLYAFPHQMEAMLGNLQVYLDEIFRRKDRMFLRGVYFASNLQQQLDPLDLQLSRILRRDDVGGAAAAVNREAATRQDSRSYFVRLVLERKVFPEQGLVTFEKGSGRQIHNRRVVMLTAAVMMLLGGFVAATYWAAQSLEQALGRHVRAWQQVAAVMSPPESAPAIVSPEGSGGRSFRYDGREVPAALRGGSEESPESLGALLGMAGERAFTPLETPTLFALPRQFNAQGDLDQMRVEAYRSVMDRAVLVPLLRAGRERVTAAPSDPVWLSDELAGVGLLAELIRCEQLMLLESAGESNAAGSRLGWPRPMVAGVGAGVSEPAAPGTVAQTPPPASQSPRDAVEYPRNSEAEAAANRGVFALERLGRGILHRPEGQASHAFVEDLERYDWQRHVNRLYPVSEPAKARGLIERADTTEDARLARLQAAGLIRQGVGNLVEAWRSRWQAEEPGLSGSLMARLNDLAAALAAYEAAEVKLAQQVAFGGIRTTARFEEARERFQDALAAVSNAGEDLDAAMAAAFEAGEPRDTLPELLAQAEREAREPMESGFAALLKETEPFRDETQASDAAAAPPSERSDADPAVMGQETPIDILAGLHGRLTTGRSELRKLIAERTQQLRDALIPRADRYLARDTDEPPAFQRRLAAWQSLSEAMRGQSVPPQRAAALATGTSLRPSPRRDWVHEACQSLMAPIRQILLTPTPQQPEVPDLGPWLQAAQDALERRRRTAWVQAALAHSSTLPTTVEGWRDAIKASATPTLEAGTDDPFAQPLPTVPLAKDQDQRSVIPAFHPGAAQASLANAVSLQRWVLARIEGDAVMDREPLRDELAAIREAGRDYVRAYAKYWLTTLSERSRYLPVSDWAKFQQRLAGLHRDEVDAALRAMDSRRVGAINELLAPGSPAARWVDAEWVETQRRRAREIESRQFQVRLNPRDLPAQWRTLGSDPAQALSGLLEQLSRYLGPLRREEGTRPFWRDLVLNGLALLGEQSERELRSEVNELLERSKRFPLCRDATEQLSLEELRAVGERLTRLSERRKAIGLPGPQGSEGEYLAAAYDAVNRLAGRSLIGERHQAWLDQMAAISDLFASDPPVTMRPFVPNIEAQQRWTEADERLIARDARYLVIGGRRDEAISCDAPPAERSARRLKTGPLVLPHEPGLTLVFYRDSALSNRAMLARWPGPWGALRQAVAAGFDDQAGGYVVPLREDDRVFWFLLRFEPDLPSSDRWPDSTRWPPPLILQKPPTENP